MNGKQMNKPVSALLHDFLVNLVSTKHHALLEMLTDDAVIEFPYHLPTMAPAIRGRQVIVKYFSDLENLVTIENITPIAIHQTSTPAVAILEYEGEGTAVESKRKYRQRYITVLTFRDQQIVHWKDYWNPLSVTEAIGNLDS